MPRLPQASPTHYLLPAFASLAFLQAGASPQTLLAVAEGAEHPNGRFGRWATPVSDLDGDGIPDLLAGSVSGPGNLSYARVISGVDGSTLWMGSSSTAGNGYGAGLAGVGDVDSDNVPDFAVSAQGQGEGEVYVYTGATGSLLYTLTDGPQSTSGFGTSLTGIGDVDGDGVSDLAVSNQGSTSAAGLGAFHVHSGATGALLYVAEDDSDFGGIYASIVSLSDLDGDGVREFAAGNRIWRLPDFTVLGRVSIYSGVDGERLRTLEGTVPGGQYGHQIANIGDVTGDGLDELAVLILRPAAAGWDIEIRSAVDGVLVRSHPYPGSGDLLRIAGPGDVDGDGTGDLAIGMQGMIELRRGSDGSTFLTVDTPSAQLSSDVVVSAIGDVDGDGRAEVGFGDAGFDGTAFNVGLVGILTFDDCNGNGVADQTDLDSGTSFDSNCNGLIDDCESPGAPYCGPQNTNSSGMSATIVAIGSAQIADNDLVLTACGVPADQLGYFIVSTASDLVDLPGAGVSSGLLCLGSGKGRFSGQAGSSSAAGTMAPAVVDLGAVPQSSAPGGSFAAQAGQTLYFQGWFRDSGTSPANNFTDAVAVTLQ